MRLLALIPLALATLTGLACIAANLLRKAGDEGADERSHGDLPALPIVPAPAMDFVTRFHASQPSVIGKRHVTHQ